MPQPSEITWRATLMAMLSVQFVIAAAFSIVPPVIPLLLPQIGVLDSRAVSLWSGLVLGVTPLAAGMMAPVWGRAVDRIDRRKIILLACGAAGICTLAMSLCTQPWQLLLLRFAMGFFGGHIVAVMALVTTSCPPSRVGAALGWMSTAQLSGMLLGPLIGGSIADLFGSYRAPFLVGGCASLCVALFVLRLPPQRIAPRANDRTNLDSFALIRRYPELARAVIVLLLVQLAISSAQPIVSLHVRHLVGEVENLATLAGIGFSVIGISGLIAAPIAGRAGDRFERHRLLAGALLGASCFTFLQTFASTYAGFVGERFAAGLFIAGVAPLVNSLVAHRVAAEHRGRAFGLTGGATFLGAFLGPLAGGVISGYSGTSRVFIAAAAALIFASLIVRSDHSTEERRS